MHLEGSFTVRALRERVWLFFIDPYALASCIDDPHDIEVINDDYFKGWVRSGVAFMKGTFTGWARITEKNPPERGHVKAHGGGMGSGFDADSTIELTETDGHTTVRWVADIVLSGTIASVGARLVQGVVDKKTNEFFENVRKRLESE